MKKTFEQKVEYLEDKGIFFQIDNNGVFDFVSPKKLLKIIDKEYKITKTYEMVKRNARSNTRRTKTSDNQAL